jgi:hypothetical protein
MIEANGTIQYRLELLETDDLPAFRKFPETFPSKESTRILDADV